MTSEPRTAVGSQPVACSRLPTAKLAREASDGQPSFATHGLWACSACQADAIVGGCLSYLLLLPCVCSGSAQAKSVPVARAADGRVRRGSFGRHRCSTRWTMEGSPPGEVPAHPADGMRPPKPWDLPRSLYDSVCLAASSLCLCLRGPEILDNAHRGFSWLVCAVVRDANDRRFQQPAPGGPGGYRFG